MTPREAAINAYNQAIASAKDNTDMAYRLACSTVEIDPTFAEGWYLTGNANNDRGLRDAAIACWRRATQLNPKDAKAWTNLAHQLHNVGRQDEAFAAAIKAIELEPDFAFAWTALSLIESITGNVKASLTHAQRAYDLNPDQPEIEFALAFACLYARRWNEGLRHAEAKFKYKLKHYERYPYPRWDGSHVSALHIVADQGMGDALSYLRFVPIAAGRVGEIILHLHSDLVRGASHMLKDCPNVMIGPLQGNIPAADAWVAITSLPYSLSLSDAEFEHCPGLPVPYQAIGPTIPWKVKDKKLHVGIAWAGAPDNAHDAWRSMKITDFLEFVKVDGVQLYALQFGPRQADVHAHGCTPVVKDLAPMIRDVMDSVQVVRDLDLVITIESGLGHVCGAAGVECWVMVARNAGDYRLGRDERGSIWYKSHRVFQQDHSATWQPVLDRVVAALKERVG